MTNNAKLRQLKITADSELIFAFKNACTLTGISMASALSLFMADYSNTSLSRMNALPDYSTRRKCRAAVYKIIKQLEQIKTGEEIRRDNTPENLQGAAAYDTAEEAISSLEEAIDTLSTFWMVP